MTITKAERDARLDEIMRLEYTKDSAYVAGIAFAGVTSIPVYILQHYGCRLEAGVTACAGVGATIVGLCIGKYYSNRLEKKETEWYELPEEVTNTAFWQPPPSRDDW